MGHGGPAKQWDQRAVLEALLEDARLAPAELGIPKPALVLVTGDLAFSGASRAAGELRDAARWLDALRATFQLERDRVFFVPGNHDVQRDVASEPDKQVWLAALRKGEGLDVDAARKSSTIEPFLRQRFANFVAFAQSYNGRCSDPFGWSLDLLVDPRGEVREHPAGTGALGFPLRLIGLNTALLSQDDQDLEKLRMGQRTLAELDLKKSGQGAFALVLTHHPLSWLAPGERARLGADIRGAHLHLCGHVHEADADRRRRGWEPEGGGLITIVAGAAHGDHPEEVDGIRLPAGHGYNFGRIARTVEGLELKVWPRQWADARREFLPHGAILPRSSLCQTFTLAPEMLKSQPPYFPPVAKRPEARLNFEDWHDYVPKRVFLASEEGFSRTLIQQFEEHVRNSKFYYYKGDIAETTSVQLLKWLDQKHNLNEGLGEIQFLLAMPRLDVMRQRDMAEGPDQATRPRSSAEMVDEVFITLFGLDAIRRKLRLDETIEVGFFSEEPYERTEILERGLYLTYYRLGGQFGTTLYYYKDSLIYRALRSYFKLTLNASRYRIRLSRDSVSTSPAQPTLEDFIRELDEQKRGLKDFEQGWSDRVDRLRGRIWAT